MSYSYKLQDPISQDALAVHTAAQIDALEVEQNQAAVEDRKAVLAAIRALSDARGWGQFTVEVNGHSTDNSLTLTINMTDGSGADQRPDSPKAGTQKAEAPPKRGRSAKATEHPAEPSPAMPGSNQSSSGPPGPVGDAPRPDSPVVEGKDEGK